MPSDSNPLRPKSLDELQDAFTLRLGKRSTNLRSYLRLSRSPKPAKKLILRVSPAHGLRLQYRNNEFLCEHEGEKFRLLLSDFEVKSELLDEEILYEFSVREPAVESAEEAPSTIKKTKHPIFFNRAMNAVTEMAEALPAESIEAASCAPTDYQVLIEAMQYPIVTEELIELDPLAVAKMRGMVRQHQLIKQFGGAIGGDEVANLLGLTRQAVDKRRREGRLIGLTQGRRGFVYPVWQFEQGGTLNHLETVLGALRKHDPWMQLSFFVNPNARLAEASPLELLREGKLDPVLQATETFGEQGPV